MTTATSAPESEDPRTLHCAILKGLTRDQRHVFNDRSAKNLFHCSLQNFGLDLKTSTLQGEAFHFHIIKKEILFNYPLGKAFFFFSGSLCQLARSAPGSGVRRSSRQCARKSPASSAGSPPVFGRITPITSCSDAMSGASTDCATFCGAESTSVCSTVCCCFT